jgi:cytochrome c oxidase assembly protein Cox11
VSAKAGAYFNKVECFCLTEQALAPGASVNMSTPFFVDPAISDDPNMDGVITITLSHTFFGVPGGDQDPGWQFDDDYYRQTDAKRVTARLPGRPSGAEEPP